MMWTVCRSVDAALEEHLVRLQERRGFLGFQLMLALEDVALTGLAEFGSITPNSHLLKEDFPRCLAYHGKIGNLQQTLLGPKRTNSAFSGTGLRRGRGRRVSAYGTCMAVDLPSARLR